MDRIVIGLIGEKGSGKGTASKYLAEKYGAVHFGSSAVLRRTVEDLHLPVTRDNLVKLALVIKEGFWPTVIMDAMIYEIEESGAQIAIADGIRMHTDLEPYKEKYGKNFYLLYITADIRTRYKRTKERKEKVGEDNMTFDQFLMEETRLTEISIHEVGATADFIIDNTAGAEELYKGLDDAMGKILNK